MADLAVGTIRVYFPHTDEFVPENCGIINGLAYYPAVYYAGGTVFTVHMIHMHTCQTSYLVA